MSKNNDSEEVEHDSYMTSIFQTYCDSCERFQEDGETECLDLGDGQKLCSDCSSIAITNMNSDPCNFIIQSVFEFFKTQELKVDEKIPIFFMNNIQIRRFTRSEGVGGVYLPSMWDYLKMESTSPLPVKLWKIFVLFVMRRIPTVEKCSISGGNIKKDGKLPIGRAIVLLFGLPDIVMGSTLAHEMMHAWLRLQGLPGGCCELISEEGLCEVMAHKWLQWFPTSGFDNPHKTNQQIQHTKALKELSEERIRCRNHKVYGQGFIDAMRAIKAIGFRPTLDYVIKNGTLPTDEVYVQRFIGGIRAIGTYSCELTLDHVIKVRTLRQTMMDSTLDAADDIAELVRKNISVAPQPDHVLCNKASDNTIKSFWRPTVAITIDFIKKATTCEALRIIIMKGDLILIGIGLAFEHR